MDDSTEDLKRSIVAARADLHQNLDVLTSKAHDLTDWRVQFEEHPMVAVGTAFVGGVIVAALLSGPRSRRRENVGSSRASYTPAPPPTYRNDDAPWRRLKGALSAVAAGAAMEFIQKSAPGLKAGLIDPVREHLARSEPRATPAHDATPFVSGSKTSASRFHTPEAD